MSWRDPHLVVEPIPGAGSKLSAALVELKLLTRGRAMEGADAEAQIRIYMRRLGDYPADVALHTVLTWPDRSDAIWWPAWAELRASLDSKASWRRLLRQALAVAHDDQVHDIPVHRGPAPAAPDFERSEIATAVGGSTARSTAK